MPSESPLGRWCEKQTHTLAQLTEWISTCCHPEAVIRFNACVDSRQSFSHAWLRVERTELEYHCKRQSSSSQNGVELGVYRRWTENMTTFSAPFLYSRSLNGLKRDNGFFLGSYGDIWDVLGPVRFRRCSNPPEEGTLRGSGNQNVPLSHVFLLHETVLVCLAWKILSFFCLHQKKIHASSLIGRIIIE